MSCVEQLDPQPRSGAKSLLLTILGEFVLPAGGEVWTSTIVDGLAELEVTERNARQALARLGDDGLIEATRSGRKARWHLTELGRQVLTSGAERIYSFGATADVWTGEWLILVCPVPESERAKRHHLRTRLGFEGFGFMAPTIAVSPHPDRESAADRILAGLGLADTASTFIATSGSATPDDRIVSDAWQLDELAADYQRFVDEFTSFDIGEPATAFAALVCLVDAWRRFPFRDPELPADLLPDAWIGGRARVLFDQRRGDWSAAAHRWFARTDASG